MEKNASKVDLMFQKVWYGSHSLHDISQTIDMNTFESTDLASHCRQFVSQENPGFNT